MNDRLPVKGTNYYRLLINERGEKTYSKIVTVQFDGMTRQLSAFINNNYLISLAVNGLDAGKYNVSVINGNGQVVVNKSLLHDKVGS